MPRRELRPRRASTPRRRSAARWSSWAASGGRREWTFGEVADRTRPPRRRRCSARGVGRGDVVMTLIGNRPEWVLTMVACFRIGAVVLACNEQLRAKDLRLRLDAADPKLIVADERNVAELSGAAPECEVAADPRRVAVRRPSPRRVELDPTDPCLITFTSGTTGEPKGVVHGQRYLPGQRLQAAHWLDARDGDLVWCTAASGWSKSARNAFIAPWLQGAAALLHDARFDPARAPRDPRRRGVNVLCMAPTEYRVIAKRTTSSRSRSLRGLVAAGEALNPEVLRAFREGTGLEIRDGYGQTETGQLTGDAGRRRRSGPDRWAGRCRASRSRSIDGELVLADPTTDPTFFVAYLGGEPAPEHVPVAHRRPGPLRRGRLPVLRGAHRRRDHLGGIPDRAVRGRVGARLAPRGRRGGGRRGARRRARRGRPRGGRPARRLRPRRTSLAQSSRTTSSAETAPYKYPRIVDFAAELPKTASGKIRRALLREERR